MNFNNNHPSGKVVYWINGKSFENDKDKRNGKDKAIQYCYDNYLNPQDIIKFDSRTERDRYEHLYQLQKNGFISNLAHHFTLRIQDEFVNANGDLIPAITYETDFIYLENETNRRIVEDVKGSAYFIDERFITLKQVFDKLMLSKGLYIRVVMKENNERIERHIGEKKKSQKLIKKQRERIKTLEKEKHDREVQERKKEREIKRMNELKALSKLTSVQRKRLKELEAKYVSSK